MFKDLTIIVNNTQIIEYAYCERVYVSEYSIQFVHFKTHEVFAKINIKNLLDSDVNIIERGRITDRVMHKICKYVGTSCSGTTMFLSITGGGRVSVHECHA